MIDLSELVRMAETRKAVLMDDLQKEQVYTRPNEVGMDRLEARISEVSDLIAALSRAPSLIPPDLMGKVVQLAAHAGLTPAHYIIRALTIIVGQDTELWDAEAPRIEVATPQTSADELRARREEQERMKRLAQEERQRLAQEEDVPILPQSLVSGRTIQVDEPPVRGRPHDVEDDVAADMEAVKRVHSAEEQMRLRYAEQSDPPLGARNPVTRPENPLRGYVEPGSREE